MNVKTQQGPYSIILGSSDGERRIYSEYDVHTVDDWRETSFGRANFGWAWIGPTRYYVIDDVGVKIPTTLIGELCRASSPKPRKSWLKRLLAVVTA